MRQPLLEALLPGHDAAFLTTSKHAQACGLNPKKVFRCMAHAAQLGLAFIAPETISTSLHVLPPSALRPVIRIRPERALTLSSSALPPYLEPSSGT